MLMCDCQLVLQVSVDKNQNRMQVSATSMRFPPLAARKTTIGLKLRPTVVALTHHASCSSQQKRMGDSLTHEEQPIQAASLTRNDSSHRSVSSVRYLSRQSKLRRRALQSQTILQRTDIPEVSAKSWMLYEMREGRALSGKRNYKKREMASLTKMMNLITVLELVERAGVDAKRVRVRATKNSCAMIGTTAQLKMGALYSLHDLYFGMMLPSGNDAAYLIAQVAGVILRMLREGKVDLQLLEDSHWMDAALSRTNNVSLFLREMNRLSWDIGMASSNFANPHGLANPSNYSTALDLCKICTHSMKNPQFRAIVNTQTYAYQCSLSSHSQVDKQNQNPNLLLSSCTQKPLFGCRWQNTNKMLGGGWSGIKTGVTPSAGPCLAASVTMTLSGKEYEFLVVLLHSETMQARWCEVRRLVQWAVQSRLYLSNDMRQ